MDKYTNRLHYNSANTHDNALESSSINQQFNKHTQSAGVMHNICP